MSDLVAITFDDQASAGELLERLRGLEHEGLIKLTDTAVLEKDSEGKLHHNKELDSGVESGAVVGGVLGLAVTFLFPVAGIAAGAAGGAVVGRMLGQGVDNGLVKDVSAELQPNTSALFLMVDNAVTEAVIASIHQFKGHVYQCSLPYEIETEIRNALGDKPAPGFNV